MNLDTYLPPRLQILMFVAEAERTSIEVYEHMDANDSNRTKTIARLHQLETAGFVTSRAPHGRALFWKVTKLGRTELMELAKSILNATIRKEA